MNEVRRAITDARRAFHDSTRWSAELMSDSGPSYEANIQSAIDQQVIRIERLETALRTSEAQQDWIAQQLRNIVTNKAVEDWQSAMIELADYIEARKAP